MEFWKNACAIEKQMVFIVLHDFGIKPRAREPNFFAKVYNMKAEDAITFNGICEQYGIIRTTEDYPEWLMETLRKTIIEKLMELKENIRSANEIYPYYRQEYIDRGKYVEVRTIVKLHKLQQNNMQKLHKKRTSRMFSGRSYLLALHVFGVIILDAVVTYRHIPHCGFN